MQAEISVDSRRSEQKFLISYALDAHRQDVHRVALYLSYPLQLIQFGGTLQSPNSEKLLARCHNYFFSFVFEQINAVYFRVVTSGKLFQELQRRHFFFLKVMKNIYGQFFWEGKGRKGTFVEEDAPF